MCPPEVKDRPHGKSETAPAAETETEQAQAQSEQGGDAPVEDVPVDQTPVEPEEPRPTIHTTTTITLAQTWVSETEWTVTQTLTKEYFATESSTGEGDVSHDYARTGSSTLTITVTNGTTASVNWSATGNFSYSSGMDWDDSDSTAQKLDKGGFKATLSLFATISAGWSEMLVTQHGAIALRYLVCLTSEQAGSIRTRKFRAMLVQKSLLTQLPVETPKVESIHHGTRWQTLGILAKQYVVAPEKFLEIEICLQARCES